MDFILAIENLAWRIMSGTLAPIGLRASSLRRTVTALLGLVVLIGAVALPAIPGARAQGANKNPAAQIPQFIDPQRRLERPDVSFLRTIRFITDDEYPPFGFLAPDGSLTGFNVDLARAICRELEVNCTIQARRFDTILPAIEKGEADAAIASIRISPQTSGSVDFTMAYYRTPARFAALRNSAPENMRPDTLEGRTIGVQEGSAHEAYLKAWFKTAKLKTYRDLAALLSGLKKNEVNIVFADGVSLAVWLNGADADNCCVFRDGPFTESRYFGAGAGIAVNKKNAALREALNYALAQISMKGVYADLYLKYFPVSFY